MNGNFDIARGEFFSCVSLSERKINVHTIQHQIYSIKERHMRMQYLLDLMTIHSANQPVSQIVGLSGHQLC